MLLSVYMAQAQFAGEVVRNVDCYGRNTGVADVTGPTGTYNYKWDNGQFAQDTMHNLSAGQHYCVVYDNTGTVILDTVYVTITQPGAYLDAYPVITPPRCAHQCSAIINIIASGGTPPYTAQWVDMAPCWIV